MSEFVEMNSTELEDTQGGLGYFIAFGLGMLAGAAIYKYGRDG